MHENEPQLFPIKLRTGVASAILALSAVSCGESEATTNSDQVPSGPLSDYVDDAIERLEGKVDMSLCISVQETDEDCDGVPDTIDQLPWRADFGDDDLDGIVNIFDAYSGVDDWQYDSDNDGLIDAFDGFNGNNFADSDQDGIYDAHDRQPYVAATPVDSASQDMRAMGNQILLNAMANEAFQQILDTNLYPESPDNPMTTDSDGDYYADYFDTEPNDPYITPRNDVYEIGSDAWYEDGQDDY